jgi:succinylglutamate desuccinylase
LCRRFNSVPSHQLFFTYVQGDLDSNREEPVHMPEAFARLELEIQKFTKLKEKCQTRFRFEDWDLHGFVIAPRPRDLRLDDKAQGSQTETLGEVDLLITALVHGDEVGGLEALNIFIDDILEGVVELKRTIGFVLANVAAARKGVRFLDADLNRSFLMMPTKAHESVRAMELSRLVDRSQALIDLHQTVEPTTSPFFVVVNQPALVSKVRALEASWPIVTFPANGFSHSGKTIIEYAASRGADSFVVELGQKGFSKELAMQAQRLLVSASSGFVRGTSREPAEEVEVYHLEKFIPNQNGARLRPGLFNGQIVVKGEVLGVDQAGDIVSPIDGRIFFPKYGDLADKSPELCEIGVRHSVRR